MILSQLSQYLKSQFPEMNEFWFIIILYYIYII